MKNSLVVSALAAVLNGCVCEAVGTQEDFAVYEQTDSWAFCCYSYSSEPITVEVTKAGSRTPVASNVGYEAVCVTQDNGILAPAFLSPGDYTFEASGADHCMRCL